MNGRVYDYNLGRFLSVDPFIQKPDSTQSINPYSYIMNNPMAGTDPTGYISQCFNSFYCSDAVVNGGNGGFSGSTTTSNGEENDRIKARIKYKDTRSVNKHSTVVDGHIKFSGSNGDVKIQASSMTATGGTLASVVPALVDSDGTSKANLSGLGKFLSALSVLLETGSTPGAGINIYPESISSAEAEALVKSMRGAVNLDTGTIRALASGDAAVITSIVAAIGDKHMLVTPTVMQELSVALSGSGMRSNYVRVAAIMSKAKLVNVAPSSRVMAVPTSRRIGANDKLIFGAGDTLGITTFTSDQKFVSVMANRGVVLNAFVHPPASF